MANKIIKGERNGPSGKVDWAILVQGRFYTEPSKHVKLLEYYHLTCKNARIIVSTWDTTEQHYINLIKQFSDEIILNKEPSKPGHRNINYQLVSTLSGLRHIKTLKIPHVLKVRTDAGIEGRLVRFSELKDRAKNKIAVAQMFTRKYLPYHPGDICLFAKVDELIDFYSAPLHNMTEQLSISFSQSVMSLSLEDTARKSGCPEIYLMKHYLKLKGRRLTYTLHHSHAMLKKYFTVLPDKDFKMVWFKAPNIKVASDDRLSACYETLDNPPTPKDITFYKMKDAFC